MPLVTVDQGSWQLILTTTKNTLLRNTSHRELYVTTDDTSGLPLSSGYHLAPQASIVVSPRLVVSATCLEGAASLLYMVVEDGDIPSDLLTDGGDGPNRRIRVDVAQTGFFAGREFRTFREWPTATTASFVIKAVVPVDIILFELGIVAEEGAARIRTIAGGVEGGTFSETLPIFSTNNMTEKPQPPYIVQTTLTAGGTHDGGGTLLDVLRVKTSGVSNFASSVGASAGAERGVLPGTYYFLLDFTGFIGVFRARWEERI